MEADGREPACLVLAVLCLCAGNQLLFRFGERLSRDVYRCSEPVRQRQSRQQLQRAVRGAQPFLAPADVCEAEMMTPIVPFERRGSPRRGDRALRVTSLMADDSERCPPFTGRRI